MPEADANITRRRLLRHGTAAALVAPLAAVPASLAAAAPPPPTLPDLQAAMRAWRSAQLDYQAFNAALAARGPDGRYVNPMMTEPGVPSAFADRYHAAQARERSALDTMLRAILAAS